MLLTDFLEELQGLGATILVYDEGRRFCYLFMGTRPQTDPFFLGRVSGEGMDLADLWPEESPPCCNMGWYHDIPEGRIIIRGRGRIEVSFKTSSISPEISDHLAAACRQMFSHQ